MRTFRAFGVAAALIAAGCTGASPAGPTAHTMTGTWTGPASDSTGSMMGAGLTSAMMASTTWTVTQNGNAFSGTMQFPGHMGGGMTVSGTMTGTTGTFTMTMSPGSMMMSGLCSATATGTFDMDDMMTLFHGTYAGTNSCTGPFDHGDLSLHH